MREHKQLGQFRRGDTAVTRSRKRKLERTRAKRSITPLGSIFLVGATLAQAQDLDSGVLPEIVVTAQKRLEDMQNVPISIQVLNTQKLEQLQIVSSDDYAQFLPSISFQSTGPGQSQFYFRGVTTGTDGLRAGSEPAVGIYLDEIPVTTIKSSVDIHIYDIARVEALSGPQGTLYGASSLSGTLRIITNKPDVSGFSSAYDVKVDKFAAGGGPGGAFEGYVNVPIAENAAIRLVGFYDHEGGYINNVQAERTYLRPPIDGSTLPDAPLTINNAAFAKSNFNDVTTYGGRAALKIDLNQNWTVTPTVLYQQQTANGDFTYLPQFGYPNVEDFGPDTYSDKWYQASLSITGKISDFDVVYAGGYFDRNTESNTDDSTNYVSYDYDGYSRFTDTAGQLIDPTVRQFDYEGYTKLSQELRISSPAANRIRFVAGAFYERQTNDIRYGELIANLPASYSVTGQPNTLFLNQMDRVDRDYALFGDATFDLTERLKASAGIRGFVTRNSLVGFFGYNDLQPDFNNGGNFEPPSGESSCQSPPAVGANLPCINLNKFVRESGETHRANLTYQFDTDRMIYGTYSTGFRPGGDNRRVTADPYAADTLSNYEIGWKSAWADRRLRFNGALFWEKWKDIQIGFQGSGGISDIQNAGDAVVKGVESDIVWLAGTKLKLYASATYLADAKLLTNFCGEVNGVLTTSCATPEAPAGTPLPIAPRFKGNVTARYEFLMDGFNGFAQGTAVNQSSTRSALKNGDEANLGPTPGFTTANFSSGFGKGNWSLQAYIENAFNERGQLTRTGVFTSTASFLYVYPIKPETFGIRFEQRF